MAYISQGRNNARPSPTASATLYKPGTELLGNDGTMWHVALTSAGIHRWMRGTAPAFIKVQSSPHKFKIGDQVQLTAYGGGAGKEHFGHIGIITDLGWYADDPNLPGYIIDPPIGNNITPYNGSPYILESSFKLTLDVEQFDVDRINKQINNIKQKNMAQQVRKPIVKRVASEIRTIDTSLINKEEVFRMLALAEATGLPCLLVGAPGVAKTKTVIEYAKAWLNKDGKMTAQDFANKIYILETDEGTKASEIKGMPDLGKLFTDNKYELSAPIAEAEIVIINEVDKASSAIRNAMLGVMNEKFLFNGKFKIPCKWKLFVATCNEIPKEEANSPFWDRFMLKMTVNRVTAGELVKYYKKGARDYREVFKIGVPTSAEIAALDIPVNKLEKYLEVGYQASSDRTLTFVPRLTKAVAYIWDISLDKALVKTAQIMISQSAGSELQNKLMSAEVKAVMSKVEMLHSYTNNEQLELAVAEIEGLVNTYTTRGIMDVTQVEEIETSMQYLLENHPARKDYQGSEEFDTMMGELDQAVQDKQAF